MACCRDWAGMGWGTGREVHEEVVPRKPVPPHTTIFFGAVVIVLSDALKEESVDVIKPRTVLRSERLWWQARRGNMIVFSEVLTVVIFC
jgi:hypothetical protein